MARLEDAESIVSNVRSPPSYRQVLKASRGPVDALPPLEDKTVDLQPVSKGYNTFNQCSNTCCARSAGHHGRCTSGCQPTCTRRPGHCGRCYVSTYNPGCGRVNGCVRRPGHCGSCWTGDRKYHKHPHRRQMITNEELARIDGGAMRLKGQDEDRVYVYHNVQGHEYRTFEAPNSRAMECLVTGSHTTKRRFGVGGIIGGIIFFPWGLFWTAADSWIVCKKCGTMLRPRHCDVVHAQQTEALEANLQKKQAQITAV